MRYYRTEYFTFDYQPNRIHFYIDEKEKSKLIINRNTRTNGNIFSILIWYLRVSEANEVTISRLIKLTPTRIKIFNKTIIKNIKWNFIGILGPSKSYKTMNWPSPTQPDPARPDRDGLWRHISRKIFKIGTWHLESISLIVLKLCFSALSPFQ